MTLHDQLSEICFNSELISQLSIVAVYLLEDDFYTKQRAAEDIAKVIWNLMQVTPKLSVEHFTEEG